MMLRQSQNEVFRYNMQDIVMMLQGYDTLREHEALSAEDLSLVHRTCDAFLANYLTRVKPGHISGAQFALLL